MTDAEREAFIEGAMWARAVMTAELTPQEVEDLVDTRGLMPSSNALRERASEHASDAYDA
jgi:hypothetical protein